MCWGWAYPGYIVIPQYYLTIRHKIFHNGIITLLQFIAGFVSDMNWVKMVIDSTYILQQNTSLMWSDLSLA